MTPLNDPRTLYRSEPLPDQDQSTPALQKNMKPKPDSGETSYKGNNELEGSAAFITGADSGIGRAVAIAFAREGADVAFQFFPGEEPDALEVKELIEAEGRKAYLFPANFKEPGEAARVAREAYEALGHIDIIVANAAQQIVQDDLQELSMEQFEDTFRVKVFSFLEIVKELEPHLKPGTSIIATGSSQGFMPSPTLIDYAAANASITNLVINLNNYFAPKGIRVNGVAPGPVWTPLQLDHGQMPGKVPEFGQKALLGRPGQPVEMAPVYVLLASERGSYITGQMYGATGGKSIN